MFKKFQPILQLIGTATIVMLAFNGLAALMFGVDNVLAAPLNKFLAAPAIPAYFNYQGVLRNADGTLMNGTVTINAKIYSTITGGTALYQGTFTNVNVRDGMFNIVLGDGSPQTGNLATVFNAAPRYIGITVGAGTELTPRQTLHGVPWALYATNAANADTATTATNASQAPNNFTVTNALTAKSATVNGLLTVNGDIEWSGHLKNMQVVTSGTGDFIVSAWYGNGEPLYEDLLPVSNNVCFLSKVWMQGLSANDRIGTCNVSQINGSWRLTVDYNPRTAGPAVSCQAICLKW